ncbi:hypothetical protein [Streptomyces sp. NPDC088812]|uniref:hypothetical protein n=1 Tax=Streptomyces sp. NPDC088812 TaxID=3365905 RepID=UPI0037F759CD
MIPRITYVLAVLAAGCAAVVAASLLPISDPATASGVCIVAGTVAAFVTQMFLPCPCHRKDGRS